MQQCDICSKVYDESKYSRCPYCEGLLNDGANDENFEDEEKVYEMTEEVLRFNRIVNCPGVFDVEGEYVRCPICGHGLHDDNGTITCPECGPI